MSAIFAWLGRALTWLGFGRVYFHVDAGIELRLTGQTIDTDTGSALSSVQILLERPAEGRELMPYRQPVAGTDGAGQLDAMALARWSYGIDDMRRPGPAPPSMTWIAQKSGYNDVRVVFDLASLPVAGSRRLLDLGTVSLRRL